MIAGIGTDIVEIERIEAALSRLPERLPRRLLAAPEFEYWQTLKGNRQAEFLAGRFAAKEALGKALGSGLGSLRPAQVSIMPADDGLAVQWLGEHSLDYKGDSWHVSISHSNQAAVAFAIWEKF